MFYPLHKKSASFLRQFFSRLDFSSRFGSPANVAGLNPSLFKVVVHLAWIKSTPRGFCYSDEVLFYLLLGKWGKPTKVGGAVDWSGSSVFSPMGLQTRLTTQDVFFPFLDKLLLFVSEHRRGLLRDSYLHCRSDGVSNVCYTLIPLSAFVNSALENLPLFHSYLSYPSPQLQVTFTSRDFCVKSKQVLFSSIAFPIFSGRLLRCLPYFFYF